MARGLLGKKIGMTQIFVDGERAEAATIVQAGPCFVTQIKDEDKDGYRAVQLAFGETKKKKNPKSINNHLKKARLKSMRHLAEIPVSKKESYELGQKLTVDIFQPGEIMDVTGISKGKGFAGVVKRHGFHGGPGSHGSRFHRTPGAIGACASPSRVFKGQKMPGRMGNDQVTIHNLEVIKVIPESNILILKGPVPGPKEGLLIIKEARRTKEK